MDINALLNDEPQTRRPSAMDISNLLNDVPMTEEDAAGDDIFDLVDFTLASGKYDWDEAILIDADDPSRFVSRRDAMSLVSRLAGMFEPDSTVCLHVPNDVLYPVLILAIVASRCRWIGSNPSSTGFELKRLLTKSNTDYLIVMPEHLFSVQETLKFDLQRVNIILFTDILNETKPKGIPDHPCLHDSLQEEDFKRLDRHLAELDVDDIAILQSTSGTTGFPKLAARSHRSVMLEITAIEDVHSAKPYPVRRLWCTPIFHAFSTPEIVFNPIRLGIPTYIMKRFDDSFAHKVQDFQITEIAAPPPMLAKLVQQGDAHQRLQSVRTIFTGGTILAPELRRRVLDMFNQKPRIVQVWGMTEGGWFTTFKYPEDDATGSVGRLIPGVELEVSPATKVITADGQEAGELLVEGPQLMKEYYEDEHATKAAFTDDWFKTGDIGYVRAGKVYLIDRVKDLIKVNGWSVAPAEIEDALLQSNDIQDAAAISVGTGVDEHPMVFLVVTGGITSQEIESLLYERLSRYKVAQVEIKYMDEIPRNHSGKIARNVLKAHAVELGWVEKDAVK